MKQYILNAYDENYVISLQKDRYAYSSSLAITMWCNEEGDWEPWDTLTVNLDMPMQKNHAFVRRDKYSDFVIKNKLGRKTGRSHRSGYCEYDEFEFFDNIYFDGV